MAHFASLLAEMVTYRITPLKDTTSSQNMLTSEEKIMNALRKASLVGSLVAACAISTGCASITTGNHQLVTVHATGCDAENVVCTIQNKDNYLTVPAGGAANIETLSLIHI